MSPKAIALDDAGSTMLIATTLIISPSSWAMIRSKTSFPRSGMALEEE